MNYKEYPLKDIFDLNKKSLNPNNYKNNKFIHYSLPSYDQGEVPKVEGGNDIKSNKYLILKPSLLVSKLNPRINRVWHVDEINREVSSICSTEFMVYQAKSDDIVMEYYYQFFKSNFFQNYLLNLQSGSTGSRLRVTPSDTLTIAIPKPSKLEQQKIASILSSVDEAIEKTEQVIEKVEKIKKGLMQELLNKGLKNTEFKKTSIGEVPINWEISPVGNIAKIIRGASPRPKGDPRYYGGNVPRLMVADVTRDKKYITPSIDSLTEEGAKKSRPLKAGSLVMVCSGSVGVPGILAVDACIHDGFLGITDISEKLTEEYLFYSFTLLKNKLDSAATHGGIFTNLTTQILKDFIITIPSIEEQNKIVEILKIHDEKIRIEQYNLNKLLEIKQGLMQQLLTGKVRVPMSENEEVPQ